MESLLKSLGKQVEEETKKEKKLDKAVENKNKEEEDEDGEEEEDVGLDVESESKVLEHEGSIVDVNDPNVNVVDIEQLIQDVSRNNPDVDSINLNSHCTPDGQPANQDNVIRMIDALKRNRHVLDVQMSGCALENAAAVAIASMLKINDTIKSLSAETNNFSGDGIEAIMEALRLNSTLTRLRLTNQKQLLHTKTEALVASALQENTTLVKLSITMKDTTARNNVEKSLMRNAEILRKRRASSRKASGAAPAKARVGGASPPCHVCSEPVYAAERLVVEQSNETLILHRRCFKCTKCKKIVKFGNFSAVDGVFYCTPHYKQLFQADGGSYSNMGAGAGKKAASGNITPANIAAKFQSSSEKCVVCNKTVYTTEKVVLEGADDRAILHQACLKCKSCETKLSAGTYMLVDGSYFCRRHGKEETERALQEKQKTFDGATDMYSAYGREYGITSEREVPKLADDDRGDVRVDDAVSSAMAKLRTTDAKPGRDKPVQQEPLSEAERKIEASFKRRERQAADDAEVESVLTDGAAERKAKREAARKQAEEEAAAADAAAKELREERRRKREEEEHALALDAERVKREQAEARKERAKVNDRELLLDLDAEDRAAKRDRERAARAAALEAEEAEAQRKREERRAEREKARLLREREEQKEEEERQKRREERRKKLGID